MVTADLREILCDNCGYGGIALWHESVRNVRLQYTDKDIIWQCSKCNSAYCHKWHVVYKCIRCGLQECSADSEILMTTQGLIKCPLMLTRLTKHNFILVRSFWKPHFCENARPV